MCHSNPSEMSVGGSVMNSPAVVLSAAPEWRCQQEYEDEDRGRDAHDVTPSGLVRLKPAASYYARPRCFRSDVNARSIWSKE